MNSAARVCVAYTIEGHVMRGGTPDGNDHTLVDRHDPLIGVLLDDRFREPAVRALLPAWWAVERALPASAVAVPMA